ncbi:globin domain-containing protein [Micromonospora aurantiaca (nom. illeg.)]|uniref:globin domain-containing protein n=1 Tax=Micromonospora aurantiaca (nom. illeg.) TaxID=47850 RepID=UPI00185C0757
MTVTSETTPISHYERIGGAAAVKAAVELFYDKVLADPDLAGYFADVDMVEQRRHLALMLASCSAVPTSTRAVAWRRRTSR